MDGLHGKTWASLSHGMEWTSANVCALTPPKKLN